MSQVTNAPLLSRCLPDITTASHSTDAGAKGVYDEIGMNVDHEKLVKPATQGLSKSNRPWKTNKQRMNSMISSKASRKTFAQRMAEKEKLDKVKAIQKEMIEERKAEKREMAEKIKRKKEQKEKNQLASVTYQQIKDTAKIKKMGKKAMKSIMKVDLDQIKAMKLPKGALNTRGSYGALK